jgi:hypothetical protein
MKLVSLTRAHFLDAAHNRVPSVVGTLNTMLRSINAYTMPNHGIAFMDNGKILAVGGVVPLWDGVGEAWLIPTKNMAGYEIPISRAFRINLDRAFTDLKMRRVQAAVKVGFERAHRLVQFLGMEEEGMMKKYGPDGADYVRYAKWPIQ